MFVKVDSGELTLDIPGFGLEAVQGSLLRRAKAGDLAAFEAILVEHGRQVLMTAFRVLGNLADAEDAAQEVFLKLHRSLDKFDDVREFAPWLYRVTVNVCRDSQRRSSRRRTAPIDEARHAAGGEADPESASAEAQHRRLMHEGLQTLAEKERAAIVLRDIEGLSTAEVAGILGSSEGTVRSQISVARTKLKRHVERFLRRPV